MKSYVADLVPNVEVTSFFLVADAPQVRKSKKGTDYACLELLDKTGKIDARIWEIPAGLNLNKIKKVIVKVKGQVSEWNEQKQVAISLIRAANDSDGVDLSDFFESSPLDIKEMWDELLDIVGAHVSNVHVKTLLTGVLTKHKVDFCRAPAAKGIHHAYIGGLLEHTLSLCRTSLAIALLYNLDISLMLAACILHDLGKTRELSYDFGISYTISGMLIGHIPLGMMEVERVATSIQGFPDNLKMVLLHLVASHHGQLEWGSPKVPLTREAIAFHLADMLDSRLAICDRLIKEGINDDGLSSWSKEIGGPLYVMPEEN